ncbi:MAG: hypothetical protein GX829_10210 [Clostridium sp.]|jgi:uncharacterized small protein (DUF1192 family)|nr:hypothetical protein [Clostridium sp.]
MIKDKVHTVEEQALGEKWEDLKDRDPKNTHKEMKLLKKKIKYLQERVTLYKDEIISYESGDQEDSLTKKIQYLAERIALYETELATLEGSYEVKNQHKMKDDGLNRLAEMKRTIGDDLTRKF